MKMKATLAALLLAGLALNAKAQTTDEDLDAKYATSLVQPGTVAPDFTMNTPDGKPFSLSSLKGKTVVLDFWASWCPDCRKDAPAVVKLYDTYHSDDVVFVGVSMDTDVAAWRKVAKQFGIEYLQVSELKKFHDTDISKAYGVKWIPSIVVVDPEGKVALATVVVDKLEQYLSQIKK
ncbi:MAG: TlpA family protein disulfide reductase [Prevotella ruminicola]|uniref:TlpA family protein disulfide reductase n=1 Tax=Xylanibacter ruminicola TaxID=839 RepID=A0A9D5P101_XYLRU|nr:TlpA family protein disulfide reductase [Xylanibacter ruminicola]